VVGEAHNAQELKALVREQPCDVVVTDIYNPGWNGLEILAEVKRERPTLPVLVLNMQPEDQCVLRALKLGASGYLTEESASEELAKAIRKVVTGETYVTRSVAEQLAFDLATDTGRPPHEVLSEREHQVLCLIASGKSVTEIADELALSFKTIGTYRLRILEKMAMKNSAELMHYAISHRLVGRPHRNADSLPAPGPG
jgi:two-component system, NarL family, invasion response regulator UvrY